MKILQVINSLNIGGAEKLIVETVPLMRKNGIKVDVLLLCDTGGSLKEKLLANNLTVFSLNSGKKNLYNPLLVFNIIPFLKRYDLVHVHLFPSQYWVSIARMLSLKKTLLVTTEHNTSNRRREHFFLKYVDKLIYRQYSKIIAISEATKKSLFQHLGNIRPIQVICNGININEYSNVNAFERANLNLSKDDFLLIMVGAFRKQKDQDSIIRSLLLLPSNVKLLLVGDGERKSVCKQLVTRLKLSHRVLFLGLRSDVSQLFKMSDVSIVSSHWEGFGLVAVEGMAVGKPVIASDVDGLNDIVYGAGLLFDKGNDSQLAELINKLRIDRQYYNDISHKCLERSKKYDINRMVNQLIELYKDIIIKNKK